MYKLPRNEIRVSITSDCNMKCSYCHNEGNLNVDFLTTSFIENLITATMHLDLKSVRITGGEPLIHPEIDTICKMIKTKFNLKVGLNTNGIESKKLLHLIDTGYINKVVIGLDFFDRNIFKDSSIGLPSSNILETVLKIKERHCNVSIATVYNNDLSNILSMTKWCLNNQVRLKIIEVVNNEISSTSPPDY